VTGEARRQGGGGKGGSKGAKLMRRDGPPPQRSGLGKITRDHTEHPKKRHLMGRAAPPGRWSKKAVEAPKSGGITLMSHQRAIEKNRKNERRERSLARGKYRALQAVETGGRLYFWVFHKKSNVSVTVLSQAESKQRGWLLTSSRWWGRGREVARSWARNND